LKINKFKQQLLLTTGRYTLRYTHEPLEVFDKTRHIIEYDTVENLVTILREYLYHIQVSLKNNFKTKFIFTRIFLRDVENAEDRATIKEETHNRAYRGLDENYKQVS